MKKTLWKIFKVIMIFTGIVNWVYVATWLFKKPEPIVRPVMFQNNK